MRFSRFFIDRPIFAGVISVIIILLGLFAYPSLPSPNIRRSRRRR
jgi:HAE1 family hydrophobic/amphiphilic exporter-1